MLPKNPLADFLPGPAITAREFAREDELALFAEFYEYETTQFDRGLNAVLDLDIRRRHARDELALDAPKALRTGRSSTRARIASTPAGRLGGLDGYIERRIHPKSLIDPGK